MTTLEACALNPPSDPAIAEPTRFLLVLTSTTRCGARRRPGEATARETAAAGPPRESGRRAHRRVGLEDRAHDLAGEQHLRRDRLAAPFDPVDRAGLLVGAVVAGERHQLRAREAFEQLADDLGAVEAVEVCMRRFA